MRVGVVGAGIAGLAAARELKKGGATVAIFEKEAFIGGRARTSTRNGCVFDTGLQTYTPRGMAIEKVMLDELATDDLVLVARPVDLYLGGRAIAGSGEKNRQPRYAYRSGATQFPKLLASGLDVRLNSPVEGIEKSKNGFVLNKEEVDAVVISAPIQECLRLLQSAGDGRNLSNAAYRPCLSLVLGFDVPAPDVDFYALLAKERMNPVLWLGLENMKAPGRAPDGQTVFVVQFGPEYSRGHFLASEKALTSVALGTILRLFGKAYSSPSWSFLERWAISQPERVVLFEGANRDAKNLIVCGDGTMAGRAENAYESGLLAAKKLLRAK